MNGPKLGPQPSQNEVERTLPDLRTEEIKILDRQKVEGYRDEFGPELAPQLQRIEALPAQPQSTQAKIGRLALHRGEYSNQEQVEAMSVEHTDGKHTLVA